MVILMNDQSFRLVRIFPIMLLCTHSLYWQT